MTCLANNTSTFIYQFQLYWFVISIEPLQRVECCRRLSYAPAFSVFSFLSSVIRLFYSRICMFLYGYNNVFYWFLYYNQFIIIWLLFVIQNLKTIGLATFIMYPYSYNRISTLYLYSVCIIYNILWRFLCWKRTA